jgi:hypothetical protein
MKTSAAKAKADKPPEAADLTVAPFSWTQKHWPAGVYPFDGKKARHLLRVHQGTLLKAHALTRIGHELVILGEGYTRWLASNAKRVTDYSVAANRPEHAAKRFGRGG